MTSKLVAYHRVSTAKQGSSGLGLEAQQAAIERYASGAGATVIASYTEVESGKNNARPELQKALHHAKATGSTLVIAKLDRLSRNAAFLLTLRDSGARFIAADMPGADHFTVGIMAMVAQKEREAISTRTKEALQAAKARGTKLGNPNGAAPFLRAGKGNAAGVEAVKAKAQDHAEMLRPVVEAFRAQGKASLGALAGALNEGGYETPRCGTWHKTSVKNLLDRLAA
ncbi:recombinase family protein [Rhodocyclus tenuis]|uniref:recombinase family protein n=1 Tax=Rhodocyclus tenuis TaxID=1066 RepID=UPI001906DB74|nr:recombinase family protein [Rhodocyclus tenuis]MBK1679756.1 resolvase [Rhodocyclus tenuis]